MAWKRFWKHVLVATLLGRQISHHHFNKRSKTTKPRALSMKVINFHINFSLLPHWQASPPQILTTPGASISLPLPLPQADGRMRCSERTRAHLRFALPAPTSPQPQPEAQPDHTWAPVSWGEAAGTVPTSSHSHGATATPPGAGSFTALFNKRKARPTPW